MSDTSKVGLSSLESRKIISSLVKNGQVQKAIQVLNLDFSGALDGESSESKYMHFQLQCLLFCEYIKFGRIDEAFEFAQRNLGEFAHLFQQELQNVVSLIAYPDPNLSPNKDLLSGEKREELADGLNSFILRHEKLKPQTTLEMIAKHLTVVQENLGDEGKKKCAWEFSKFVDDTL